METLAYRQELGIARVSSATQKVTQRTQEESFDKSGRIGRAAPKDTTDTHEDACGTATNLRSQVVAAKCVHVALHLHRHFYAD